MLSVDHSPNFLFVRACTSIVALDKNNQIIHGRNLDGFGKLLRPLMLQVDYKKKEKVIYCLFYTLTARWRQRVASFYSCCWNATIFLVYSYGYYLRAEKEQRTFHGAGAPRLFFSRNEVCREQWFPDQIIPFIKFNEEYKLSSSKRFNW